MQNKIIKRCDWALGSVIEQDYHDTEWGVPLHDDRSLFEFLILEGVQAGLSWRTVLNKRENYRQAFDNFDIAKIANYQDKKLENLLQDSGLVRNRLKILAARKNAIAALTIQEKSGSLNSFLWSFVDGKPIQNQWTEKKQVPARTGESDRLSKALQKEGFTFVGSTICYAFMQATGMVNDHLTTCFRHKQVGLR